MKVLDKYFCFLQDTCLKYIRNSSLPEAFELSTDKYHDSDDYHPVSGSMNNDTDEDLQQGTSESQRLIAR